MAPAEEPASEPRFGVLRAIALYKFLKVSLLVLAAYGELRLRDATLLAKLLSMAAARPTGLEHYLVTHALQWLSGLSESTIHLYRLVTLAYAAVFAVEGVGLWMRQRWAEWLTTIVTASLIPMELWELFQRPTFWKAGVVVANIAIVGYLYWHVSTHRKTPS